MLATRGSRWARCALAVACRRDRKASAPLDPTLLMSEVSQYQVGDAGVSCWARGALAVKCRRDREAGSRWASEPSLHSRMFGNVALVGLHVTG